MSAPTHADGHYGGHLGEHQVMEIVEEQIQHRLEQEQLAGTLVHSLFNEMFTAGLLFFAVQHLDQLQYGDGYIMSLFQTIVIIFFTNWVQSQMDTLISNESRKIKLKQQQQHSLDGVTTTSTTSCYQNQLGVVGLYRQIKVSSTYVQKYYTFIAFGMVNNLIRIQSSDEPWTPTKVLLPLIVIHLLSAAKILIEQRFFQPINVSLRTFKEASAQ